MNFIGELTHHSPFLKKQLKFFSIRNDHDPSTAINPIELDDLTQLVSRRNLSSQVDPLYQFKDNKALIFPVENQPNFSGFDGQTFDVDNEEHRDFIVKSTEVYLKELNNLLRLDQRIPYALAAYMFPNFLFFSWIPLSGFLSSFSDPLALMATGWLANQRIVQFNRYFMALELMKANLAWSLGNWPSQTSEELISKIARTNYLIHMVDAIAPALTYQELKNIIADSVEQSFLENASSILKQKKMGADYLSGYRALYGSQSDTYAAFLFSGYKALSDTGSYLQNKSMEHLNLAVQRVKNFGFFSSEVSLFSQPNEQRSSNELPEEVYKKRI